MAGLHIFAARRLIDADQPREALTRFGDAAGYSPGAVARVWYKVLQAFGGAAGLSRAFQGYRIIRRRIMHRGRTLRVGSDGLSWIDHES